MSAPVLHHVGSVVPKADEMTAMMAAPGLVEDYRDYVTRFQALGVFFALGNGAWPVEFEIPDGGSLLKLNKGMGELHHLADLIESLDTKAGQLMVQGMKLLEPEHVQGAAAFLCHCLSPGYTEGLSIEYVQSTG